MHILNRQIVILANRPFFVLEILEACGDAIWVNIPMASPALQRAMAAIRIECRRLVVVGLINVGRDGIQTMNGLVACLTGQSGMAF